MNCNGLLSTKTDCCVACYRASNEHIVVTFHKYMVYFTYERIVTRKG